MKEITFDNYLNSFDCNEQKAMKIENHTPLNELPNRLNEIDKNKTVVTMCPHYVRVEIARIYLKLKGFNARYLTDGMLGLVDFLRGDRARDTLERIKK